MKIPAFADIGKQAADLLYGNSSAGLFQYNQKVTLNMKSAEGLVATAKAAKAGESLSTDFKLKYVTPVNRAAVTIEHLPAMKQVTATVAIPVVEGVKFTTSASTPDISKSVKGTIDYVQPYLTSKAIFTNPSNLTAELSAATGYNGFVLGGITKANVKSSNIDSWRVATAYIGKDFVASAHSDSGFQAITGTYWQQLDAASSIAAEVKHVVGSGQPDLSMGYCHISPSSGNMYKVKLGSDGAVHLHTESKPRPDTTLAISVKMDALKPSADPQIGFAIDHAP